MAEDVEAVILGCTHFPILEKMIQDILGPKVKLIDPGQALSKELAPQLEDPSAMRGTLSVFITDDSPHFVDLAQTILKPAGPMSIKLQKI